VLDRESEPDEEMLHLELEGIPHGERVHHALDMTIGTGDVVDQLVIRHLAQSIVPKDLRPALNTTTIG
jgi:hypothetical protein